MKFLSCFVPRLGIAQICLTMALVLRLTIASATSGASDTILLRGNGPEPATLDAHKAQDLASFNVLRDLYEGLLTEDAFGKPAPGMAARWEQSDDGLQWTFYLRPNLRWSDGSSLTAAQIVAGFQRAMNPQTLAPFATQLAAIENADLILQGKSPVATLGVVAKSANQVVIRLSRPVPLPQLLTLPVCFPVRIDAIKTHGARHTHAGHLISNGAYRLQSWVPQSVIELERNPFFHAADSVQIKRVRFFVTEDAASEMKRFQAGDLHITETVPPVKLAGLQKRFGKALRIAPYLGVFYYGLNVRNPPLKGNAALREALSLALDRDILTTHVTGLGETPAMGLVPPALLSHTNDSMTSNKRKNTRTRELARAKTLMQAVRKMDHSPVEVELRYNTSSLNRKLALAVASMWREQLGIKTRLLNEEWKVFVMNRKHGRITQAFRGGWIADYADAMSFLEPFERNQPLNTTGFADAKFDHALQMARAALDNTSRNAWLRRAEQIVLDAHVIVPIYFYSSKHLVHPRLRGYESNPLDHHASRYLSWGSP